MRSYVSVTHIAALLLQTVLVHAQQNCYFGPGAGFRGPSELVPCNNTGISACCLLGDTCLTGNSCYNYATGNLYQYGCTDITYSDSTCPQKCGFDVAKSPWIGLEYCTDIQDLENTWTCLAPESCGCKWKDSYELQILPSRACGAMGSEARVALYAPSTLLPYVSLPSTVGGSTGYYSTTTDSKGAFSVISTAISGYTPNPDEFTQFTGYRALQTPIIYINPGATAAPATNPPAFIYTDTTPPGSVPPAPTSSLPASSTSTPSTLSSVTRKASATPTSAPASSGLSTGAKAGIGVGVAGGVCLLVAVGACGYLIARRKKKQQELPQYPQSPPPMGPYLQGQAPSGWAPFPPGGFYVAPNGQVWQKEDTYTSVSPQYSPPHSPPPPTELSTHQRPQSPDGGSAHSRGRSPPMAPVAQHESGSPRFHEGPF